MYTRQVLYQLSYSPHHTYTLFEAGYHIVCIFKSLEFRLKFIVNGNLMSPLKI